MTFFFFKRKMLPLHIYTCTCARVHAYSCIDMNVQNLSDLFRLTIVQVQSAGQISWKQHAQSEINSHFWMRCWRAKIKVFSVVRTQPLKTELQQQARAYCTKRIYLSARFRCIDASLADIIPGRIDSCFLSRWKMISRPSKKKVIERRDLHYWYRDDLSRVFVTSDCLEPRVLLDSILGTCVFLICRSSRFNPIYDRTTI